MNSKKRFLGMLLIAALFGCATISVQSDFDPSADFSSLHTYTWLPDHTGKIEFPRPDDPLLDHQIRNDVENQMSARGFQKGLPEKVDFYIVYHVSMDKMSHPDLNSFLDYAGTGPDGSPSSPSMGQESFVNQYTEGSLIIDIIDRKTLRLLWRGSSQTELSRRPTGIEKEKKIDKAVEKILDRFPPR
ncbi:MAG: DUF4136 domain-containing protein [Nitrospiria bacterium]